MNSESRYPTKWGFQLDTRAHIHIRPRINRQDPSFLSAKHLYSFQQLQPQSRLPTISPQPTTMELRAGFVG